MEGTLARSLAEQALEALRLAEADPAEAVALAADVARRARQDRDFGSLSVAERVLGMAALQLEDPDAALRHLRAAVRLGRRAGSAGLAAEAQTRLAYVLNVRGYGRQALREIETALAILTGVARARAQAQRGAILSQLGRLDEALPDFQAALAVLRRAGDHVWVQRALYNRAVLFGYRQEFTAADNDLREAGELCARHQLDLSLGFVHQNQGWISGLRGDVPAALHHFDLAEQRLREHGAPVGELLADRAELLLSVRLLTEAMQAAAAAVQEFGQQRRQIGLPEARLLLAQAAILDGQAGLGLEQARAAVREFTHQGRHRWVALARFTVLRARAAGGPQAGPGPSVRAVERAADELTAADWAWSALQARLLAGSLALSRGWSSRGAAQFAAAARHRDHGPALQRAQAWYAEAQQRWAAGDRRGAASAARTALRVHDEHWTGLGATDLRAHASGYRAEVAAFGLRLAFGSGRPGAVLEWAEQGRASHLMLRPVRPPRDPALAAALSELRATVSEIFRARGAGGSTAALARRQLALERWIRDYHRRLPADAGPGPARGSRLGPARSLAGTLTGALGDAALLEFVQLDGTLHVVTVASGRIGRHVLGPADQVFELIDRARFALHRLARHQPAEASQAAARVLLADAAGRLDRQLLGPVAGQIGDRPLVVVPTGALQSLPWSILPSCAGRPVTVTPSAALWLGNRADAGPDRPVVVAAGPGLPGAEREAVAVADLHRVTPLLHGAAAVDAVAAALDGASVAHLSAHGRIHPSNPLFTSLTFADGPLTVYDVERLRRPPRVVVLAACDVGRSAVRAGDEVMGLSATFLALGTSQVVASVVPVPDAETVPLMVAFHRRLAAGTPTVPALAAAQAETGHGDAESMAAAAGFISIGTAPRHRP